MISISAISELPISAFSLSLTPTPPVGPPPPPPPGEEPFPPPEGQLVTARYASHAFTTRQADSPAHENISGRIARGVRISRALTRGEEGMFGSLITTSFGELELNNADGALDSLINDYYADGRPIRLYIGATEIMPPARLMPKFIGSTSTLSGGDTAIPFPVNYPSSGVLEGDLLLCVITINDRGGFIIVSDSLSLEGDQQSGTDLLLLEGDMQAGTDSLLLE